MPATPTRARGIQTYPDCQVPNPILRPGEGQHSALANVLIVSPNLDDQSTLCQILRRSPCEIAAAHTCREALARLNRIYSPVIFCDRILPDGTWLDILDRISGDTDSPFLIVTSRHADVHVWAEVLNLGGFDLLHKPFDAGEVLHVVTTALLRIVNQPSGSDAS
jgi:DNA-binding NtrC family response regulator